MNDKNISLKRGLSFQLVTYYGFGNIVDAGIYVFIGKVAGHARLCTPLTFLIASLVAALTAFTYAELFARYPLIAGEAVYLQKGFNIIGMSLFVGLLIVLPVLFQHQL